MNFLLSDYQRHYVEAHNSGNEAIKQLNKFREHFSQLVDSDKRELFQKIITEQELPDDLCKMLKLIFFGTLN